MHIFIALTNGALRKWSAVFFALAVGLLVSSEQVASAQGVFLTGLGPVNQSMGGAATAAPIDSIGALNWNPASISGMRSNEMSFGLGLILPTITVSSAIAPNPLAPAGLSGSTGGEPGVMPAPAFGFVHKPRGSQWTFGLGIYGIGGFSANYPSSTTNPVLLPQAFGGLGRVFSQAQFYQIAPTVSYAITEKFSFGIAPTITLAQVQADPLFLSPPNGTIYGPGTATRTAWGGGFQAGVYYITDFSWHFGASYKSPQWFEPLRYNSNDAVGLPVSQQVTFNLPSIISLGAAYTGINRTIWATDVRYWDYGNALGFRQVGFNPNGSVAGLGWHSVWSVSTGLQYDWTSKFTVRGGYTYGDIPINNNLSMFNVPSALIIQHWLSCGASYRFARNVSGNIAYTHGFQNSISGPFQTPFGPVPGTSVASTISADILNFGLSVNY